MQKEEYKDTYCSCGYKTFYIPEQFKDYSKVNYEHNSNENSLAWVYQQDSKFEGVYILDVKDSCFSLASDIYNDFFCIDDVERSVDQKFCKIKNIPKE